jgi:hypothetical protein
MTYVSISRNFRGFNYKTDWVDSKFWEKEMERQCKFENEIEWSFLISDGGNILMKYKRGFGCLKYKDLQL